jgi:hypothetical protein
MKWLLVSSCPEWKTYRAWKGEWKFGLERRSKKSRALNGGDPGGWSRTWAMECWREGHKFWLPSVKARSLPEATKKAELVIKSFLQGK